MVSFLPILLCFIFVGFCNGQIKKDTTLTKPTTQPVKQKEYKPEIFTSGFIDIVNNGQVNASARFIRLFIGEPGKFAVPLSFYGGVSNNSFQNNNSSGQLSRSNDHLVNQYSNPLSGLINISVEGVIFFRKGERITKSGLLYQFGERVLTGVRIGPVSNPLTGKPINFLNSFATTGLYSRPGHGKGQIRKI